MVEEASVVGEAGYARYWWINSSIRLAHTRAASGAGLAPGKAWTRMANLTAPLHWEEAASALDLQIEQRSDGLGLWKTRSKSWVMSGDVDGLPVRVRCDKSRAAREAFDLSLVLVYMRRSEWAGLRFHVVFAEGVPERDRVALLARRFVTLGDADFDERFAVWAKRRHQAGAARFLTPRRRETLLRLEQETPDEVGVELRLRRGMGILVNTTPGKADGIQIVDQVRLLIPAAKSLMTNP